jgi:predicted nucleic acid-binding protein
MLDDGTETLVVDASVAAKFWFEEDGLEVARNLRTRVGLSAPDFLVIEMASIAAKRVRRGLSTNEEGSRAVREVVTLVDEFEPSAPLAPRAFELARDHGVSVYDGLYLALAEARGARVLTADEKLVKRARAAGLGALVQPLIS